VALSITFWGTRGSIPAPGRATIRYGGNTPCLTIEDQQHRRLILDAGSGIRALGKQLVQQPTPQDLVVLLSHTHWDHIQGLPFFGPLFSPGNSIRILGPGGGDGSLRDTLRSQMAPAVFPVPLSAIGSALEVDEITSPEISLPGFLVRTVPVCHPGRTLGFAVQAAAGGPSVSYLTDNELAGPIATKIRPDLVRFLHRSDTLVHDAMYFDAEVAPRAGWGHSSAVQATKLALEAEVRRLVLFHHDPDHDDAALERLLAEAVEYRERLGGTLELTVAAEGTTLSC
jgi:phosphoribosyl 1,2-cyclic phosphodiesterase